ncbi:SGNH/GDSL hydrolase family protein [Herbidospora sp. RD11066]
MRPSRRLLLIAAFLATLISPVITPASPALAEPPPSLEPSSVQPELRDRVLGANWQKSADVALTTAGDATGFHVFTASAASGYQWRTVATLTEPGMDTDQWIGNACLTGSGSRIVAVYAPRHFTNRDWLFSRGAFAAIIDTKTGAVTKLRDQVTLAYFNPGCGAGDTVALTQGVSEKHATTRLLTVDTAANRVTRTVVARGQLTSAVSVGDTVVAADGARLVEVKAGGELAELAATGSVPFDLRATADGGVAFATRDGESVKVRQYLGGTTRELAAGRLGDLTVQSGVNGRVFLVGQAGSTATLPQGVSLLDAPAAADISSEGGLAVTGAAARGLRAGPGAPPTGPPDASVLGDDQRGVSPEVPDAEPVDITAQVVTTRMDVGFEVQPGADLLPLAASGRVTNPKLALALRPVGPAVTTSVAGTVDTGYRCAIPRNDPSIQVYQPHWRQVEWAVDQLVFKNRLTVSRPAGWKGLTGLPGWNPQSEFPVPDLQGGGRIPVSVMFGILAQESNLWQAQRSVLEGETGNPLVGNFYGVNIYDSNPANDWDVDFTKADCGYGISQQTDNMRGDASQWSANKQKRVATDYVTNIAAGMSTLAQKWNEIWNDTGGSAKIHDGDPSKIENWYMAVWAYNSGWHAQADAWKNDNNGTPNNGAWGVGWTNNPANSNYRQDRRPFLDNNNYSDAAHPQDWPYQEKVLGWAAWPITKTWWDPVQNKTLAEGGYNYAWWTTEGYRTMIVPTVSNTGIVDNNAFCAPGSECQPPVTGNSRGTCQRADFKCWWHFSKAWKDCASACGHEASLRYDSTWGGTERAEPQDQWTTCRTAGLPVVGGDTTKVLIVDDTTVPAVRGGCDNSQWTNSGTLTFDFAQDSAGRVPARADFQQLGNGFGGHSWFGYTRTSARNGNTMQVTGTWKPNEDINGWARVLVHIPKRRAETQQAPYTINLGNNVRETRYLSQSREQNAWYNLGVFPFSGRPEVSLTNLNLEGDGSAAISWDAVAFQVLRNRPKHFVVAMGDSITAGEGVGNYAPETDFGYQTPRWNACRRSSYSWIRQTVLPGETQTVGQLADSFDPRLDFAFVACSGADSRDVWVPEYSYTGQPINSWGDYRGKAEGRFREAAQLESGFLTKNTTLVALSLGANDADWSNVLGGCYLINCKAGGSPYEDQLRARITDVLNTKQEFGLPANVADILQRIEEKTKNKDGSRGKKAKIVLMGYPNVVGSTVCSRFDQDEVGMLQRLSAHFVTEAKNTVRVLRDAGNEVSFADSLPAFAGHGACDAGPWVNPVMFTKTGPGDFTDFWDGCMADGGRCASRSSLHPTQRGAQEFAAVFKNHLTSPEVNYTGW